MAMRRFGRRHVGDVDAVDEALPSGDLLEARDHSEQRRLAAARGAEQRGERALLDLQAEVADGGDRAVALGHAPEFDMRRVGAGLARFAHPLMPADSMIAWVTLRWKMR